MSSLFKLNNDPGDCNNCILRKLKELNCGDKCPLQVIFSENKFVTPLSHIDCIKYVVHTNNKEG